MPLTHRRKRGALETQAQAVLDANRAHNANPRTRKHQKRCVNIVKIRRRLRKEQRDAAEAARVQEVTETDPMTAD